jgi:hypothetical protein
MKLFQKIEVLLFTSITMLVKADSICDFQSEINIVTFTGVENDASSFERELDHENHDKFSMAVWIKMTSAPAVGKQAIVVRYHNKIKLYIDDDGSDVKLRLWALDANPNQIGLADIQLDLWTLIWVEISGTNAYLIKRDQAGQTSSTQGTLSKFNKFILRLYFRI